MQIGMRIYYDILTGDVILNTGERSGDVVVTTVGQDFESYKALADRVSETVGMIQLEYGQYAEDFMQCDGYRIDPVTEEVLFSYSDPDQPNLPLVHRKPLTEQVAEQEQEIAEMWFDNMTRHAQHETEIAELWYVIMGGEA